MTRGAMGVRILGAAVIAWAIAVPSWAQSGTGVSAALVGDIVRSNRSSLDAVGGEPGNGEGLTFSLRLDRALGSRWGVELEYVHGAELEFELNRGSFVMPAEFFSAAGSSLTLPAGYRYSTSTRWSTIAPMLWYRQPLGTRTSLVYSAGMGFGIGRSETTYTYTPLPNQNTLPPMTSKYTSYTINPIVGVDARIGMTDHLSVVPGVRLLGADGGILLRPSAGLRWEF